MSTRNFNNTTSVGSLTAPVSPSDVFLTVTGFAEYPAPPFTATVERNQPAEEVVLVTAVNASTLTVTRGFNGTAAQTHLAGATVEHTTVALDFSEANEHINATEDVHGAEGQLVGAEGAQTLLDKTLVAPLFEADVSMGDAITAYVPPGAEARNLFRGMNPDGDDVTVIDSDGALTATAVHSTGNSETDGNHQVDGNLTVGGTTALTGAVTIPVESASSSPVRKSTTDGINTRLSTAEATLAAATSAATANQLAKRDGSGRLAVANGSASGDAVNKGQLDAVTTAWTAGDAALDTRLDVLEANHVWYSNAGTVTQASTPKIFTGKVGVTFTGASFVTSGAISLAAAGFSEEPYVTATVVDTTGRQTVGINSLTATSVTFLLRADVNTSTTTVVYFTAIGK